jgi:hypothetical protein
LKVEDQTAGGANYAIYTGAGLVRFGDDVKIAADNKKLYFGAGFDASIYYDGTNMIINAQEVGAGELQLTGSKTRVTGDLYVGNNAAADPAIVFDGDTNDGQITYFEDEDYFGLSARINITGITEYADNAAALTGGLVAGDLYRTGDALKIVH